MFCVIYIAHKVFNKLYTSGEQYLPGSRPCGSGGDHSAGNVHHHGQHPALSAARGLHQGERRLFSEGGEYIFFTPAADKQ